MALSLEDSNLVWQKAKIALATPGTAAAPGGGSVATAAFKALKERLAGVGGNPTLQLVPIVASSIDDTGGQILADVACRLYGVFGRKQATGVDTFLNIIDDATDDTFAETVAKIVLPFMESGDEAFVIYPAGLAMTIGVVAKGYVDNDGATDAAAADTPNGFVIIGAA